MGQDAARLDHVSEVVSLARLVLPSWTAEGARGEHLADPESAVSFPEEVVA